VAVNQAAAVVYAAGKDLESAQAREDAETAAQNLRLAFARDKLDAFLPLISSAIGGADSGTGGGGSIGFQSQSGGMTMASASSIGDDVSSMGGGGMGYYSRRTVSGQDERNILRMGAGDVKRAGIGFAATGRTIPDGVAATQLPYIRTSGVLTPAQVQQSVNSVVARTDTRAQSEIRRVTSDLTGRGFSPSSPILAALRVGIAGQGLRASLDGVRGVELESAKINADAIFAGQKATSDQFLQQEQFLAELERIEVSRTVGILGSVAQMISSASG